MSKGKRFNKKNYKKYMRLIFIVVFILSNLYILNFVLNSKKEQQEINELIAVNTETDIEENKNEEERIIKVKELKEQYSDLVAWIEIEGTSVNYPVMQGSDNDYYMNHDYKKEETKKGSIFLDKDYDWTIPSSNLLLYGHNNSIDNSMFGELLKYKDKKFYDEHPTIRFTTTDEDAEYEIISVFLSRVYYKKEKDVFRYYYFINAENEQEYNEYVNNAKNASLYDTGKTAKYGDQLITLSTCEYSQEDGRFVVVARKKSTNSI